MIPARQDVPIRCFGISAFVCRVANGSMDVLLIRRDGSYLGGTWQMVSGKIEKGETAWEAALREIKEETGLTPDRFYSANRLEQFYEVNQNCINLVPIFVGFMDVDSAVQLSDEHTDFQWVSYDKLSVYVSFPHQAETALWIYDQFVQKMPSEFLRINTEVEQGACTQPSVAKAPSGE
jgi:dATP pyrophosphohydrolase